MRRAIAGLTLVLAASVASLAPAPASAQPSEGLAVNYSSEYSTHYFGLTNVCAKVWTHFIADDRGSYVVIKAGSYAAFQLYNCSTGAIRYDLQGRMSWQVTASGWALDGCGGQIPWGFGCSGGISSITVSEDWTMFGSYTRMVGAGESYYFNDSAPGDISSVTSRVNLVVNGIGLTATSKVAAP